MRWRRSGAKPERRCGLPCVGVVLVEELAHRVRDVTEVDGDECSLLGAQGVVEVGDRSGHRLHGVSRAGGHLGRGFERDPPPVVGVASSLQTTGLFETINHHRHRGGGDPQLAGEVRGPARGPPDNVVQGGEVAQRHPELAGQDFADRHRQAHQLAEHLARRMVLRVLVGHTGTLAIAGS